MSWREILKLARTNDATHDKQHGPDSYLVNDDIYREAGGQVLGFGRPTSENPTGSYIETEGDRFMDIEDIEEAIGRKLTINDFKNHHLNWKSNTNKTLLDRVGGFKGQQRLAENQIREMMDSLHRGKPMDSIQMYENIFKAFLEIFGDVSSLTNELIFVLKNYMGIDASRRN